MSRLLGIGGAALALAAASLASATPLRLAVAANFQAAFAAVATHYPQELTPSFGSSGLLHAQIVQGRPFDAFLSPIGPGPERS